MVEDDHPHFCFFSAPTVEFHSNLVKLKQLPDLLADNVFELEADERGGALVGSLKLMMCFFLIRISLVFTVKLFISVSLMLTLESIAELHK